MRFGREMMPFKGTSMK